MSLYTILVFVNRNAGLLAFSVIMVTAIFLVIKAMLQPPNNKSTSINKFKPISPMQMIKPLPSKPNNQSTKPIQSNPKPQAFEPGHPSLSKPKPKAKQYPSYVFYGGNQHKSKPQKNEANINIKKAGILTPSLPKLSTSILSTALASIQRNNSNPNHNHHDKNHNHHKQNVLLSPIQDIVELQQELDTTNYPQYLDGYSTLNQDQKTFLSAIKNGDLSTIKYMAKNCKVIQQNVNFGECQVIRECTLENRVEILKYLKQTFVKEIDLNCESGYCLRWCSRKGFIEIIQWLLTQKYQEIDISPFQYQAIEWSIVYKHKQIAKILQKYYKEYKLKKKWNMLNEMSTEQDLGVEFDIFNLPSIYQEIIQKCIDNDADMDNINTIKEYYEAGCDLKFENNMPWMVAVDCTNIPVLEYLYKTVGVDPLCKDNYLLRTSCDIKDIGMLQFAKTIINWQHWKNKIQPKLSEFKKLCHNDPLFVKELENYHKPTTPLKKKKGNEYEMPLSPIPWPYENKHVRQKYGILTRSKRKMLVKKGILEDDM